MKKTSIIIAAIIVLVASLGYYSYVKIYNDQNASENSEAQVGNNIVKTQPLSEKTNATGSPIEENSKNNDSGQLFKTYHNEQYKFTFEYPTEFTLKDMLQDPYRNYLPVPENALVSQFLDTPYLCEDVSCIYFSVIPLSIENASKVPKICWLTKEKIIGKAKVASKGIECGDGGMNTIHYYVALDSGHTLEILLDRSASGSDRIIPPPRYANGALEEQVLSSLTLD